MVRIKRKKHTIKVRIKRKVPSQGASVRESRSSRTLPKPTPPLVERYLCPCCNKQTSDMQNAVCIICWFCRQKDGNCACGRPPREFQIRVDMEKLKALLRQSGVNIDKILKDDMRAFRKSLQR